MNKLAIIAVTALCVSTAQAAELNGIFAADVAAIKMDVPAPVLQKTADAPKCNHVTGEIAAKLHLLAQTAKSQLFTFAKTEAEFKEFTDMWTPILAKFDMKVIGRTYDPKVGFGTLQYVSADGSVVREFQVDGMTYDALSQPAMDKLKHELLEPLEKAGLTPVAVLDIKNPIFRPTFRIYYLTKPEENMDREAQLRQLKNGDDIDFDLLANAVNIVKKDATFSMVYIGKLVGSKSKLAKDELSATMSIAKYKEFLAENKKEFIASRTSKLDKPFTVGENTYNFVYSVYFFQ
ncbi:MAG TPA: hypothetical protein DCZ92_06530 [Elusimicrobia bacterium]|nr:MAG: hypothetical protein A2016_06545 [Elusimicrobia bacterium GWF2_62_30]HBA60463.1 hypothetical protein [Elusimicrobiota bacterium]